MSETAEFGVCEEHYQHYWKYEDYFTQKGQPLIFSPAIQKIMESQQMSSATAPLSLDEQDKPRFFDPKTESFTQVNRFAISVMENLFAAEGDRLCTDMTDAKNPVEVRRKLLFTMRHLGRVSGAIDANYPEKGSRHETENIVR
jgi:hypothetical protein